MKLENMNIEIDRIESIAIILALVAIAILIYLYKTKYDQYELERTEEGRLALPT